MSEPEEPANPTAAIIDALEPRDPAAVVAGHFSLDPEAARAKLREHQLDDPNAYILLLVEAAALAGAGTPNSAIRFELGATTTAEFGALPLDADALEDLLAAVFAPLPERPGPPQRRARARRLLGLAANAALAAGASAVELESVDEQGRARRVTLSDQGPARLEQRGQGRAGTCRFRFVGRALDRRRAEHERSLLFSRCRYSSFPVLVDDQPFNLGHAAALPEGARAHPVTLPGAGPIGLAARGDAGGRAKAIILTRGVLAELVPLEGCQPGFVALVEVDLRKDLSQRRLVRDAHYDRAIRAILEVHAALPQRPPRRAVERSEHDELPRAQLALILALVILPIPLGLALIGLRGRDPGAQQLQQLQQLQQACDAGEEPSCVELASRLDDRSRARELLEHSCARGHAPACEASEATPSH